VNEAIARNPIRNHSFRLSGTFDVNAASSDLGVKLFVSGTSYTTLGFDPKRGELYFDRRHSGVTQFSKEFASRVSAPLRLASGKLQLDILADRNSVEVFADGGHIALTNLVFPPEGAFGIETFSSHASSRVEMEGWTLRSVWP
jgi:fructan beta-fructosidase